MKKKIADESVTLCDEIINVADSVSTNVTNAVPTNATPTVSINSDDKKVKYKMHCHILHKLLLEIIILSIFIIAIICYHYTKHRSKQKRIGALKMQNWKILI